MQIAAPETYVTKRTLAATLAVGVRTIERHMTTGLPFHRFGGSVRFLLSEVENYFDAQERKQL